MFQQLLLSSFLYLIVISPSFVLGFPDSKTDSSWLNIFPNLTFSKLSSNQKLDIFLLQKERKLFHLLQKSHSLSRINDNDRIISILNASCFCQPLLIHRAPLSAVWALLLILQILLKKGFDSWLSRSLKELKNETLEKAIEPFPYLASKSGAVKLLSEVLSTWYPWFNLPVL